MDELLAKQVLRQLRILNTFLIAFAVSLLIFFVIAGIVIYKAVQELHKAQNSLNNLQTKVQSSLNVKSDLCNSKSSVSSLLKSQSQICN
jgi:uncharacterized protein YoxC